MTSAAPPPGTAVPARRSRRDRALDAAAGRMLRLPPATHDYAVTRRVRVPMRDGVTLAAHLYLPTSAPKGTLLVRCPYGRGVPFSLWYARIFAARGYTVLFVSSRGTFTSGGTFDPMRTEADDGRDVVRWLIAQPWFTGTFATLGLSYLGHTQWALLVDPPPELVAASVTVGPHDFSRHTWGTGAFNFDLLGWSDMILHQEDGVVRGLVHRVTSPRKLRPVLDGLPLADVGERYLAGRAPWYRERVTRPDLGDPYWRPMQHGVALERTAIPVLLHGGWHDLFLGQTIEQYARLRERGVDVALTVGPWTHIDLAGRGAGVVARETLDWFEEHLAGTGSRRRSGAVRVFVTGRSAGRAGAGRAGGTERGGGWRWLPAWPPATTSQVWYLRPGAGLSRDVPTPDAPDASFTYDPADPTPTVGGPLLSGGGVVDDARLAARGDVLEFTGEPLADGVLVAGAPVVELAYGSDNPHADVFVRLSEVDPKGRSRNVTEGYRRLDPARASGVVTLAMRDTAHRFAAGSRVRLLVAGGSHPQYARNLGTAENPGTGTTLRPSTRSLTLADGASRLVLLVATP
jgi:putative CocE/NonD family hydrolase